MTPSTETNPTFAIDDDFLNKVAELAALDLKKDSMSFTAPNSVAFPSPAQEPPPSPHALAAAVLGSFNPERLVPLMAAEESTKTPHGLDLLLADSLPIEGGGSHVKWTLKPHRRIEALRYLREQNLVKDAMALPNNIQGDSVGENFRALLVETRPDLETESMANLATYYKVASWLRDAGYENLPDFLSLGSAIEAKMLLEPFEHLAGKNFKGRVDELRRLRSHLGIVKAKSFGEKVARTGAWIWDKAAAMIVDKIRKPMLVVGPGGVGKSTLIAKFILEHAEAHRQNRFPFAYLDFDRPDVSAEEPVTLLIETVRQLGIQYPEVRESCDRIRQTWLERIAWLGSETGSGRNDRERRIDPEKLDKIRRATIEDLAALVGRLDAKDQPIVLVLDTFEEAQNSGQKAIEDLRQFLEHLGQKLPSLFLVIAGRADIPGWDMFTMELGAFDEDSAMGYLETRGVSEPDLAKEIYRQVGGSPLSLKLAADLVEQERSAGGLLSVETRDFFFRRLSDEQIQAQLYRRVLGHIRGERASDLRKLAHPGLVLRRLTPELIQEVLAEPCGVVVTDLADAKKLFDQFAGQVSLVSRDNDGSLRHRSDLRRLMLTLLHRDEPEKTRTIHAGAVKFYEEDRNSDLERAEEIYHRIWLDQDSQTIRMRWREGLRRHLLSAQIELEGARKACLAALLNIEVDEATLAAANLADWEILTAERARKLLGTGNPESALKLIRIRSERSPGGPLPDIEARALVLQGKLSEALPLLNSALVTDLQHGETKAALDHGLLLAEMVFASEAPEMASIALSLLENERLETKQMDRMDRIELFAKRALLGHWAGTDVMEYDLRTLDDLIARFSEKDLNSRKQTAYWAAAVPGKGQPVRLATVLQSVGLPALSEPALRSLGLVIARFDSAWSRANKGSPGDLARRLDVSFRDSVIQTWGEFLVRVSGGNLGFLLARLVREYASDSTPELLAGFKAALFEALLAPFRGSSAPPPPAPKASSTAVGIQRNDLREVADKLLKSFGNVEGLRSFMASYLDRSLDALVDLSSSTSDIFKDVVRLSVADGSLPLLVTRALETRPDDLGLAKLAARLGISTQSGRDETALGVEAIDDVWRSRLALLEGQVCWIQAKEITASTAFLVGPDILLTNGHFVSAIQGMAGTEIFCRFDYRADDTGQTVTEGTVVRLKFRDWLITSGLEVGNSGGPGYALLRLAQPVGVFPIVKDSQTNAAMPPLRRWIELPDSIPSVSSGDRLYILHHPEDGPLDFSSGLLGNSIGDFHHYDIFTAPGSSGAPCFNEKLEPIAMHLGTRPTEENGVPAGGFGIGLNAVLADLKAKGLDSLVRSRFE